MPQQRAVPARPNTTYVTPSPVGDSHAVDQADALLDEIDAVLEDATEVLTNFRQRGGE